MWLVLGFHRTLALQQQWEQSLTPCEQANEDRQTGRWERTSISSPVLSDCISMFQGSLAASRASGSKRNYCYCCKPLIMDQNLLYDCALCYDVF